MSDPDDVLQRAAHLLRQHTDTGWTTLRPSLLDRAMRAIRPSDPVRGRHELGDYLIRADVFTDQVRRAVDAIPGAAASSIVCVTGDDDRLTEVTIRISAGYGTHIPDIASGVHGVAFAAITGLLGELAPGAQDVHTHVHVEDVFDDRGQTPGI